MNKWISVKDRLPETFMVFPRWIILSIGTDNAELGILSRITDQGNPEWRHKETDKILMNVTHWMPLPAPPESK